jgi:hypothetical protein
MNKKVNIVELHSAGVLVDSFYNVKQISIHDGYIEIRYVDEDGRDRKVNTNLPYIYYDGV